MNPHTPTAEPSVTFWGAAHTVTGSMHVVEANGRRLLLDCGLFQGHRAEAAARNGRFPFDPGAIDLVVLSHAHLDHCGNLPTLVRRGFAGPIYCTPATRDLAAVMLADAASIQEEDAEFLNRHRDAGAPAVQPLYQRDDVRRTLRLVQGVPYQRDADPGHGFRLRFVDAGHLLGSAMVSLTVDVGGREHTLTFTGDVGRHGQPILRDPDPVPPAGLLVSESTYGGQTHPPAEETTERLGEVVRQTAERGGKLLIPAFSLGRTQTVVYDLHRLMSAGRLPDLPIFVDSPLAANATEVYRLHPECFDDETATLLEQDADLFGGRRIHYVRRVSESRALNGRREPCVIIAASGMCEAGRILHHLAHNVEDPRTTVLLVGFQAPDTLGRRLAEHQPEVRILNRTYRPRAEVVMMSGFSSHADQNDLLRAFAPLAGQVKRVRLVHGEPQRAEALALALRRHGFADTAVPDRGDSAPF
jgi:metallo-beta-lactamase family protein